MKGVQLVGKKEKGVNTTKGEKIRGEKRHDHVTPPFAWFLKDPGTGNASFESLLEELTGIWSWRNGLVTYDHANNSNN